LSAEDGSLEAERHKKEAEAKRKENINVRAGTHATCPKQQIFLTCLIFKPSST